MVNYIDVDKGCVTRKLTKMRQKEQEKEEGVEESTTWIKDM